VLPDLELRCEEDPMSESVALVVSDLKVAPAELLPRLALEFADKLLVSRG
jgi:hypothetical protein